MDEKCDQMLQGRCDVRTWEGATNLADINEPTHQILVAESVDRVLCLISCLIFNDATTYVSTLIIAISSLCDHLPASLYHDRTTTPYPSTNVHHNQEKASNTSHQLSPPCSFRLEVIVRRRKALRQLICFVSLRLFASSNPSSKHTLTHEILQMMPLNIV